MYHTYTRTMFQFRYQLKDRMEIHKALVRLCRYSIASRVIWTLLINIFECLIVLKTHVTILKTAVVPLQANTRSRWYHTTSQALII